MSKNQIYKHGEKRGLSHGTGPVHLNCRACARNIEMLGKYYNELVYFNKFSGQIIWAGKYFLIHIVWYYFVALKVLVAQLCLTLCDPVDCSPPGSSVHGILHLRILECVAISFSRGSSWSRDQTWVSWIAGRFFTIWATSISCHHCIVYPSLFLIKNSLKLLLKTGENRCGNHQLRSSDKTIQKKTTYVCMSIPVLDLGLTVPFF